MNCNECTKVVHTRRQEQIQCRRRCRTARPAWRRGVGGDGPAGREHALTGWGENDCELKRGAGFDAAAELALEVKGATAVEGDAVDGKGIAAGVASLNSLARDVAAVDKAEVDAVLRQHSVCVQASDFVVAATGAGEDQDRPDTAEPPAAPALSHAC